MLRTIKIRNSSAYQLTFSLPPTVPERISVVGDFNDWTPGKHVLAKRANGTRSVAVTVPAGAKYRFRYLGENAHWFDDDTVERDGDAGLIIT